MSHAAPARPVRADQVTRWDWDTDVAIVGFGASGACAAIEAAEAGAKVMLLEAGAGSGGASAWSGGEIYFGGGTEVQKSAGFNDTAEALESYLMMAGGPDADAEKVRLYARNSVAHFEWIKAQGVPYKGNYLPGKIIEPADDGTLIWSGSEEAWPFYETSSPAPRGHVIQFMGWGGGRKLVDILEARVRAMGVDIRVNAYVENLIADAEGAVVGLVVRIDNEQKYLRSKKGVVLCTGGFCMNSEMLKRYTPEVLRCNSPIGERDDGSGIMMGMAVGADAIHMDEFFVTCPWIIPESFAKGVFVNSRGNRFINEDCYHGRVSRAILDQPGDKAYLLLDSEIFAQPLDLARISVAGTGDTWEEVEQELGMPEGTLSSTMRTYNRYAVEGEDPVFRKRLPWLKPLNVAPYAAVELNVRSSFFSFFTLGGLRTKSTGEVLDRAGERIPGLFAAGRAACGLPRWGAGYSSGMSLADCTFFGRLAGRAAAGAASN